jgi:demethylsterigmatocystin 6-O-methyltransferase
VVHKLEKYKRTNKVTGARFYYMRTVLHDWDEENSIKILKNTAAAMGPDSQLLIDEMALPNKDVHWWSACLDLHMYTMLNALERTVDQWHELLGKAGLKLVDIRTYASVMKNSIIVVERL